MSEAGVIGIFCGGEGNTGTVCIGAACMGAFCKSDIMGCCMAAGASDRSPNDLGCMVLTTTPGDCVRGACDAVGVDFKLA